MSKCVLVMDMPSSCDMCEFVQVDDTVGNMTCMNPISEVYGCDVSDYIGCRSDGCPLREFPNKIGTEEALKMPRNGCISDVIHSYNACIDELLKGEEG